jgi:GntR family transcriptional regulator / MocR family aminotransferase
MNLTPLINKSDTRSNPIYVQIYNYLRLEIEENRLEKSTKLPSIRSFAKHLEVNKNTVENAYQQLEAEGYIMSKQKSGWYVCDLEPEIIEIIRTSGNPQVSRYSDNNDTGLETVAPVFTYDFRHGKIDARHFPSTIWRRIYTRALRNEKSETLYYGNRQGELKLRREVVRYLYQSRGVNCHASQIVIGSTTQNLLAMLTILFKPFGQSIAFEDPGYDIARIVFQNADYEILPIILEEDGVHINQLYESNAKSIFITPSHQFPYGMILPIKKRMQLLQWANEVDGFIIEDDYDGEFRFQGHPVPSLQGMDKNDSVIYLGTFSKSLAPAFGIAYLVLPQRFLTMWNEKFFYYNPDVSLIHQEALYIFMQEGHWSRHLKKMRKIYGRKQEQLLYALHKYLPDQIRIKGVASGLHILIEVPNLKVHTSHIVEQANALHIGIHSTEHNWFKPEKQQVAQFILGFGGISEENIDEGIRLLASIIKKHL